MTRKFLTSVAALAVLSACADTGALGRASAQRPGFGAISDTGKRAQVGSPEWHLSAAELASASTRANALISGRTISAETAVRAALLNNRGLQATYADLGLSATELWRTALGPTPSLSVSVSGLAGDVARGLEATLISAVLETATAPARTQVAELRFQQAQLAAAGETVALAIETRRAWIEAVAAFEQAALTERTQNTANAASELSRELGRTGAMNAANQARGHAFTAEVAAELSDVRLEAQLAKEHLARLMGVSLGQVTFYVPDALPGLPGAPRSRTDIERLALANRLDLAAGRLQLDVIAAEYRLAGRTRMVSDITILAGVEAEREDGATEVRPALEVEFEVPLYDTRNLTSRRGAMTYLRAANVLAEDAVNARSEARSAHMAVTGKHAVARHWRDVVLPLRRTVDEEALKSYSGMITSTFDLLDDARDGLEAQLGAVAAKRDYWLAETDVTAAIWGPDGSEASNTEGDNE